MMHLLFTLLSIFTLQTRHTTLALDLEQGGDARIVYYGARIDDTAELKDAGYRGQTAYPAYGLSGTAETALALTQADGNKTLDLAVRDWILADWEDGQLLTVTLEDRFYPVTVRLYYKTFRDEDMIETWTRIDNDGKKPVVLTRFDPSMTAAAAFADRLRREGLAVYLHSAIPGYPADVDRILSDDGFGRNPMVETTAPIVGVIAPGPSSGKLATCLSQVWHENRRGVGAGYAKYETFPVWNLPLSHAVNIAYEAATADIEDFNQIDPFHLEAYGETTVNYNRDVAAFPILRALLERLLPADQVYRSPTDLGVNKVGFAIADDDRVQEASRQEIVRRFLKGGSDLALGRVTEATVERLRSIMAAAGLKDTDRPVVVPAREAAAAGAAAGKGFGGICCAAALQLPDGSIVTGKNSSLLRSPAATILNAAKRLAGIPDSLELLPKTIVQSVADMKSGLLGRRSSNLNVEELLIALAISANMNSVAALALQKLPLLRGCEMHMTHLTSASDASGMRRLGLRVTCDPLWPDKSRLPR